MDATVPFPGHPDALPDDSTTEQAAARFGACDRDCGRRATRRWQSPVTGRVLPLCGPCSTRHEARLVLDGWTLVGVIVSVR